LKGIVDWIGIGEELRSSGREEELGGIYICLWSSGFGENGGRADVGIRKI
jgi:hypothetical protein